MYVRGTVGFRPIESGDLEILRALRNDMATLLQLGNVDMASSEEQGLWWKGLAGQPRSKRFTLVEISSGQVIGLLRLDNMEQANRNCEAGLDIVPERRGQGLGRASYQAVLEYLFEHLNMHMVYVKVGEFNGRAKKLYSGLGFRETGHLKEYLFRHGKYWNYCVMCMTREEYYLRGGGVAP